MPLTLGDVELCVQDDGVTVGIGGSCFEGAPLTADTLADLEQLRHTAGPRQYGARLFDALFGDDARNAYAEALTDRDRQWRIHLDLRTEAPAAASVWWESLTAKGPPPTYIGHSSRTPFSRRPPPDVTVASYDAIDEDRLKVLVVVSTPTDLDTARWRLPPLDEEVLTTTIESAMRPLADRVEFDFQSSPASAGRIRARLEEEHFHILHILGHVTVDATGPCFVLENDDETAAAIGHEELAELVMELPDLRLVVLASCDTGGGSNGGRLAQPEVALSLAPTMIEYGVPAVVAMHDVVDSDVARLFTERFYPALGRSKTGLVDEAVNRARANIYYSGRDSWDWTAPVLFMAGSGRLVEPYGAAAQEPPGPRSALTPTRPVEPPKPAAPRGPSVRGGKPIPEIPASELRDHLFGSLVRLRVTHAELAVICDGLPIEVAEITAETSEGTILRLVEIAIARDAGDTLYGRINAISKTRAKAVRPAHLLDNPPRALGGRL